MTWRKEILRERKKEIIQASLISLIFTILYTLFSFRYQHHFAWEKIEPIDQPSIFGWVFYSVLTYCSLGALVYATGFYKILHDITVKIFGLWWLYNTIKRAVWVMLMFVTYWLLKFGINLVNTSLSFGYNIGRFLLFVFPIFGVFLFLLIALSLLYILIFRYTDPLASKDLTKKS